MGKQTKRIARGTNPSKLFWIAQPNPAKANKERVVYRIRRRVKAAKRSGYCATKSPASRCFSAMYAGSPTNCTLRNSFGLFVGSALKFKGVRASPLFPARKCSPNPLRKGTKRPNVRLHRQTQGVTTPRKMRDAASATPVQLLPRRNCRSHIHAPRKGNTLSVVGLVRAVNPHTNPYPIQARRSLVWSRNSVASTRRVSNRVVRLVSHTHSFDKATA